MALPFAVGHGMPAELQVPVKASDIDAGGVPVVILQGLVADDIYHGTHNSGGVASNSIQERFQPACMGRNR